MNKKLGREFLAACNKANCCFDDFVMLPEEGDVGILEYIEYKAEQIVRAKNLYSPLEQHMLMLSYPAPNNENNRIFEYFFESPSVVALNDRFVGCFGIDVTAYLNKTNHPRFEELLSFIGSHNDIVFVLFVYTNDNDAAQQMFSVLCNYDKFRKMSIPLPHAVTLCAYTSEELDKIEKPLSYEAKVYLAEHYRVKPCGFDAADWLVSFIQNNDFDGSAENLKNLIEEAEKLKTTTIVHTEDKKIGFKED